MKTPIEIRVNGQAFVDYTSATVSMGIEEFARSFSVEFSDKWINSTVGILPFSEGDACEVLVHGEKVIDGFIDSIPIDYDKDSHSLAITGRSWTGHLVDCSAVFKGGSWRNADLITIATDITDPFGVIPLVLDDSVIGPASQPFKRWAIEDEEKAFDCIARAAKLRGLFLISDAGRRLIIAKASKVVHGDVLKFGDNVLRGRRTSKATDRFSEYLVKSQSAGDDTWYGTNARGNFFKLTDEGVKTYRPLVMVADGPGLKDELQMRATYERNVRAGRARMITYEVQGFKSRAKKLWPVNELVSVDDDFLHIKDTLLISSVTFTYSEQQGEITSLELCRPEAFDIFAPPPKPKKSKKKEVIW